MQTVIKHDKRSSIPSQLLKLKLELEAKNENFA